MPHGSGPCRQGQYFPMLNRLIKEQGYENVGVFSMSEGSSYGELGTEFYKKGWIAITIADVVANIRNALLNTCNK